MSLYLDRLLPGLQDQTRVYGRYFFGRRRPPAKRFILLAHGRSGSGLMRTLLNSHPDIYCDREILHNPVLFPAHYAHACSLTSPRPVYGFKCLYSQLQGIQGIRDTRRFLQDRTREGWQLIYLHRRNALRQAVSLFLAQRTGRFAMTPGTAFTKPEPFSLTKETLIAAIRDFERADREAGECLRDLPFLDLTYEDDLLRPSVRQLTLRWVFRFLKLPEQEVWSERLKMTPYDLSEIVANYRDLEQELRTEGYGPYLEDPVYPAAAREEDSVSALREVSRDETRNPRESSSPSQDPHSFPACE